MPMKIARDKANKLGMDGPGNPEVSACSDGIKYKWPLNIIAWPKKQTRANAPHVLRKLFAIWADKIVALLHVH